QRPAWAARVRRAPDVEPVVAVDRPDRRGHRDHRARDHRRGAARRDGQPIERLAARVERAAVPVGAARVDRVGLVRLGAEVAAAGAGTEVAGAVLSTEKATSALSAVLPAPSRPRAITVCPPFDTPALFHASAYGADAATPADMPST